MNLSDESRRLFSPLRLTALPGENKVRVSYFDNLKLFLIFLVVFGHVIDPMTSKSHLLQSVFVFIYIFHMPLFVFISGYFSKSSYNKKSGLKTEKVVSWLLLFLLYTFMTYGVDVITKGFSHAKLNLYTIKGPAWFMFAMAVWTLLIPFVSKLRPEFVLSVMVLVSCFAGYDKNYGAVLCGGRVITFMPFFFAGYFMTPHFMEKILNRKRSIRAISLILLIFIFSVILFTGCYLPEGYRIIKGIRLFVTAQNSYQKTTLEMTGGFFRLFLFAASAVMGYLVMLIIPTKKLAVSAAGGCTLSVYVWHYLLCRFYMNLKIYDAMLAQSQWWKAGTILIAVVITAIFANKFFEAPLRKIMGIKLNRFYKN